MFDNFSYHSTHSRCLGIATADVHQWGRPSSRENPALHHQHPESMNEVEYDHQSYWGCLRGKSSRKEGTIEMILCKYGLDLPLCFLVLLNLTSPTIRVIDCTTLTHHWMNHFNIIVVDRTDNHHKKTSWKKGSSRFRWNCVTLPAQSRSMCFRSEVLWSKASYIVMARIQYMS